MKVIDKIFWCLLAFGAFTSCITTPQLGFFGWIGLIPVFFLGFFITDVDWSFLETTEG